VSVINRAPLGWLGFLGIKNFGRNPATTAEILAPTWDLAELYLSANRSYETGAFTISGLGYYLFAAPNPGKVYYVNAYGAIMQALAAGNVLDFTLVLYNVALGYGVPIGGTGPTIAAPVGSRPTVGLQNPVIIHAGESLAIWVSSFAGANITGQFNICYTRLDA